MYASKTEYCTSISAAFIFLLIIASPSLHAGNQDCFYTYQAEVTGVYDGDTVTADIDLGFGVVLKGQKLRLARIDAPELRGNNKKNGLKSRDWLRGQVLNRMVTVRTKKDKKGRYGRYIVEIFISSKNINDELVSSGFAVHKSY